MLQNKVPSSILSPFLTDNAAVPRIPFLHVFLPTLSLSHTDVVPHLRLLCTPVESTPTSESLSR